MGRIQNRSVFRVVLVKKSLCCSPLSLGANDENKFLPWRTKNKSSSPVTDLNLKSSQQIMVLGLSIKSK